MTKRNWDLEFKDMYRMGNGTYYLRYWSAKLGRDIEKSLKTDVKARALKERKRILENLDQEKDKTAIKYKKFKQVVAAYLLERSWDSRATELVELNQINKHLLPSFGNYDPDQVNNNLWRKYAQTRRETDPNCSLHNARKYLAKILNWANFEKITKKKVVLDDFDTNRKSISVELSSSEFLAIWKNLNQDWQDISEIGWEMGCRVGEIKALSWERVNFKSGELIFEAEDTKNDFARRPVMTDRVREILLRRKELARGPYVFASPHDPLRHFSKSDQAWQVAKRKAQVKCRFHDLRHTWLRRAFRVSNRYAEICAYAGLSLKKALETYIQFSQADMTAISQIHRGKPGKQGVTT
jgi:integrase